LIRTDVKELHYITAIENAPSILANGIVSNRRATAIPHNSVASSVIQSRRAGKIVPGARPLHDYANLYFNARNPMMSALINSGCNLDELCVLRISANVIDLPDVVIADSNASSKYVRFNASPSGLNFIDQNITFAASWKHPGDQIEEWKHISKMCAEVLVPDVVSNCYIMGAYVSCIGAEQRLRAFAPTLSVSINAHLFFQ
jgi:hypothetical protein